MDPRIEIIDARTQDQLDEVRELFNEYAAAFAFDRCFEDFGDELDGLPGEYAPPGGRLLLGHIDDEAAGCVAMRRFDDRSCEMKRLYLRPDHRGTGLGRKLAATIVETARQMGYSRMYLDTLAAMEEAQHLYRSLGFEPCEPYSDTITSSDACYVLRFAGG